MRGVALLLLPLACVAPAAAQVVVYQHDYPYDTPELVEDHFVVLDSTRLPVRGWYYGTSDEFDDAREGYLPGFFVAEMRALALSGDRISFTLARPSAFFTAPVPTRYRSPDQIPEGELARWDVSLPDAERAYTGRLGAGGMVLELERSERAFRRVAHE